jgi:hypothetical protein
MGKQYFVEQACHRENKLYEARLHSTNNEERKERIERKKERINERKKKKEGKKETKREREGGEREREKFPNESAHLVQTSAQNNNKTPSHILNAAVHKILPSSSSFSKYHTASRYMGIRNFIYAQNRIKVFLALVPRKSYMMNTITCTSHTKFHQNRAKNLKRLGHKSIFFPK